MAAPRPYPQISAAAALITAGSERGGFTGSMHTCFETLGKCFVVECFSGLFVELPGDSASLCMAIYRRILPLWNVLSLQAVGIFVGAALPCISRQAIAIAIYQDGGCEGRKRRRQYSWPMVDFYVAVDSGTFCEIILLLYVLRMIISRDVADKISGPSARRITISSNRIPNAPSI
jgi:hypothetical protein